MEIVPPNTATKSLQPIVDTRRWIQHFVLRHNLCPFAHHPFKLGKIRYAVVLSNDLRKLETRLVDELNWLHKKNAQFIETTLIIHPAVLTDFFEFNDYVHRTQNLLHQLDLVGELQVASFHPAYQFADVTSNDPSNLTNRSPYPMLHLLREVSLERAIDEYGDTDQIWQRNVALMRTLGVDAANTDRKYP